MRIPPFAVSGAAALLASCAPTPETAASGNRMETLARQCFNVSQVNNYRTGRSGQVFLRVGRSDVYQLDAAGGCMDLDFAQRVALVPDGASIGSRLCSGDWATVVVPGSASRTSTCRVRISQQLTEAEIAALPAAYRP